MSRQNLLDLFDIGGIDETQMLNPRSDIAVGLLNVALRELLGDAILTGFGKLMHMNVVISREGLDPPLAIQEKAKLNSICDRCCGSLSLLDIATLDGQDGDDQCDGHWHNAKGSGLRLLAERPDQATASGRRQ